MSGKIRFKFMVIMSGLLILWIFGFYGWYIPKHIRDSRAEIEEVLIMNNFEPIEMIEVKGLSVTSIWTVYKTIGQEKIKDTVKVQLDKGHWFVNPN